MKYSIVDLESQPAQTATYLEVLNMFSELDLNPPQFDIARSILTSMRKKETKMKGGNEKFALKFLDDKRGCLRNINVTKGQLTASNGRVLFQGKTDLKDGTYDRTYARIDDQAYPDVEELLNDVISSVDVDLDHPDDSTIIEDGKPVQIVKLAWQWFDIKYVKLLKSLPATDYKLVSTKRVGYMQATGKDFKAIAMPVQYSKDKS